jgi:hypothetical protein
VARVRRLASLGPTSGRIEQKNVQKNKEHVWPPKHPRSRRQRSD